MLDDVLDEISRIEEDLDDRESKIAALETHAKSEEPGSLAWAEYTIAACEHRQALGDRDTALAGCLAVRDAGTDVDPPIEVHLLTLHLEAGNDEAVAELDRTLRLRSRAEYLGDTYNWVGESYEDAGRLKEALRWFSMANRDIDPDDLDNLEPLALSGRLRVRQVLGLAEDAYDESARILREEARLRWAEDD